MKKTIAIWVGCVFALFACNDHDNEFIIDGQLTNNGAIKKILLYQGENIVDSAFLNDDNKFRFRKTSPVPQLYGLEAGDRHYFFVLQNGEKLTFKADLEDPKMEYSIEGSEVSSKLKGFNELNQDYLSKINALEEEFTKEIGERPDQREEIIATLRTKYDSLMHARGDATVAFAKKNSDNLAGFYAISSLDDSQYIDFEKDKIEFADRIKDKFGNNQAVKDYVAHMAELKPLSIGQKAPEFELLDMKGKTVKLSDFRGKYTLIDFWASWCQPCRLENPNIVKQYQRFNSKGFDILGVSLDSKLENWKQAVAQDQLTWTHVSDLSMWNSKAAELYKVRQIPSSFLLDPEGVIVAKNLRGEALGQFLETHLP
ncbi:TlpA disulfide reductase family protein [Olivibacter sitiensis]|uniref:TlpA disulfide reductase family protein n=1 Tax=Olivibacter sitiensis TaxID=376470 RepID=UPI0004834F99|nr:TlpA disulfide reductase family protein [Olivibacter sitiensis]